MFKVGDLVLVKSSNKKGYIEQQMSNVRDAYYVHYLVPYKESEFTVNGEISHISDLIKISN